MLNVSIFSFVTIVIVKKLEIQPFCFYYSKNVVQELNEKNSSL